MKKNKLYKIIPICFVLSLSSSMLCGCDAADILDDESQDADSQSERSISLPVYDSSESDQEEVHETPQCFKNVSLAEAAWGKDWNVLINKSKDDPEDDDPYIRVKSDDQGTIRYIEFEYTGNNSSKAENMSVDGAISTIAQYIDLDYLHTHYTFNSSYGVEKNYPRDETYYMVYDPDASEQAYGRFYIVITVLTGDVTYITAQNEGVDEYGALGEYAPENISNTLSNDHMHYLIQWNKQL